MGVTTELRRQIETRFVPLAVERGFSVDLQGMPQSMIFRRMQGAFTQIFEVQWQKYGSPRFTINFGTCPNEGVKVAGQLLEGRTALPTWLPDAGTLQPRRGASSSAWFRQDVPLWKRPFVRNPLRSASAVVDDLLRLFPELEAYWQNGHVGPHMRLLHLHQADSAP